MSFKSATPISSCYRVSRLRMPQMLTLNSASRFSSNKTGGKLPSQRQVTIVLSSDDDDSSDETLEDHWEMMGATT